MCQCPNHAQQDAAANPGRRQFVQLAALGGGAALLGSFLPQAAYAAGGTDALLLSCMGSATILEPSSAGHIWALGFVEPLLRWFAGCTAPVTLFCTGLWAEGQQAAQAPSRREVRKGGRWAVAA